MLKAGIAGAGIMGRLLAFRLLQAGWQVTLFDQYAIEAENVTCSQVAGGLLTPVSELDKAEEPILALGQAALKHHWPNILAQLPDSIYFRQSGTLALAHPGDQAELTHFIERISRKLHSAGVNSGGTHFSNDEWLKLNSFSAYQQLTPAEITQLEPELTKFQTGYYFPAEGHIDSQGLWVALGKYLLQQGATWHTKAVVKAIAPYQISLEQQCYHFDMVFDCRGLGAKSLFSDLRGMRGELIWLSAPLVNIQRPIRFLHPRYSLYVVPRPQNIYLVGASEIESEDISPITVKTSLELLTAAYYLHPGFGEARVIKSATHCRPTLTDHLPKIKAMPGLIAINGLYRHGYLLAPTLADDVLPWLNGGITAVNYPTLWEAS